ncbi:MAG: T9SS type A sorting domain-containing protein [Cyclobacteriaceae bacterium]|nr:T9SS type A sorting domain-containing protein [Cyclobacteriaceae bacterium]
MVRLYSYFGLCCLLLLSALSAEAQRLMGIKVTTPTICYAHTEDNPCTIPPPEEFMKMLGGNRTKTATIEINYNPGFTPAATAAFDYAIGIWESLIDSPVPIKIDAYWSSLNPGVLGGALYTAAYANFDGAQKLNVFYPVAMAEKIAGRNLNGDNPDIFIQFNNTAAWHYDPTTTPFPGLYDLATVVLHEIGHGLGFAGTFNATGSQGSVGLQSTGVPIIYDVPVENFSGENLIQNFASPSTALGSQLVSSDIFFNSASAPRAKLYAPFEFNRGSSISHLDESTFNGTPNALMTPQVAPQEQIHSPGLAWEMLKDLGWEIVKINHQRLTDTEDLVGPYEVTATIFADNGFDASSLKLNYTTNGTDFTEVDMTPTGVPNEFSASIPSSGATQEYGYFISVDDTNGRQFVNPGKIVRKLNTELQNIFVFSAGPDTKPPVITHSAKPFMLEGETSLPLEARVTDNIGIASVVLEYSVNGVSQTNQNFVLQAPEVDSIYLTTINFGAGVSNGDVIAYRIVATDNSSNSNARTVPATGFFTLNVVGLEPTQDSYANDFNTPSNDFFGNGFSITQPAEFNDGAIHSDHPYPEGNTFPNQEINLIYQLKIPIRVKASEATVVFDEIVLVEPGEPGTVFGNQEFWDYVIVEGSKDGGLTWIPIANGYDSRDNSAWLARYNSAISGNNSTAVGDPTLYRTRTLDLRTKFSTNDEVVLRFRLYSDPFAAGWGWAIDNLKIQIDDNPPTVLHDHIDYLTDNADELKIIAKATDASGIEALKIEYKVNGGTVEEVNFIVNPPASQYEFSLTGLAVLSPGDRIEYRIVALDSVGNEGFFPPSGDFILVPIVAFGSPIGTYANNFNSSSSDFVGNFFSIAQPSGFNNGAIHSAHFYPNGIGLDKTSSFSYTLTKPITISASNSLIRFDEIVIVEGHGSGVVFGNPAFKDYVIVEGSKDGGATWSRLLDGYDIVGGLQVWSNTFFSGGNGNSEMFRTRTFDLKANGNFQSGNQVILRFRLFADESINGWGWAIDNLFIQDPVTSIEVASSSFSIYPNPLTGQFLTLKAEQISFSSAEVELISPHGQSLIQTSLNISDGKINQQIDLQELPPGMYLMRVITDRGDKILRKIIKTN